ncbi:ABC transporter permease [Acidipropionibacterium acidipropionici]|jgi:ABC-2 type transport system permease protein|uniref:ABC transporter permease n=1 Tax=Acidipropionibacterium acidipropionici TaxID=1748 RepID=A0AAC9FC06_9ACTN|nr:ABC transporter permease [Acidipropionibacterium acidipropionici]AMS04873.1 ABC transporter permease [Acidipropionibacterium acidipropionici]AOZ46357.1 ABC transporter permease [Acidipropionibacterium acidipropionici]AZP37602.1 ABC transporter permease [Acidipropionibacterium acidipropionici]
MSALDLHPAPQAAPAWTRIRNHGLTEAKLVMRNGEQLILALVVPVVILVAGRFIGDRISMPLSLVAPSVLALAIWSTCFTSQAIQTGFDRRYGVLERLAATPLGRSGLLAGKGLAYSIISVIQVVLLVVVALALGWHPHGSALAWLPMVISLLLGMSAFSLLALAFGGSLRAEATLALANLIYLVGMAAGAVLWPLAKYPGGLRDVVAVLPTTALAESLRAWDLGQVLWWPVLSLVAWTVVLGLIARKVFKWVS